MKVTFGTGGFMLVNTGEHPVRTPATACSRPSPTDWTDETTYALEGSIFAAGAAVQWLRDGLGIIRTAAETEGLARSLESNGGVYLVPAFTGLGAPHWDPDARGALYGLTRATGARRSWRARRWSPSASRPQTCSTRCSKRGCR